MHLLIQIDKFTRVKVMHICYPYIGRCK